MADVDTTPLPARQTGETDKAYGAFLDYCQLGAGRSLGKLVETYRGQSGGKAGAEIPPTVRLNTLEGWSTRFGWQERVKAWDQEQAALEQARWEERRREVRESDWQTGDELRKLAAEMLKQAPRFVKGSRSVIKGKDGSPDREIVTMELSIEALFKAAKLASDLQRLAAEMAPPVQQHKVTGTVVSVTADDLAAAREMAQKLEEDLLSGSSDDDPDNND